MAFVQGTGIQSVGTVASVSKAFASNVTAGNLIAVAGVAGNTAPGTTDVTDGLTNSYTRINLSNRIAQGGGAVACYYSKNILGGSCTVTLDVAGNDSQSIGITELSGRDTTAPLDGNNTGGANDAAPVTGSFTTAGAASDIFGCFDYNGASNTTMTKGATYTLIFSDNDSADMPILIQYREAVAPGSYTADGTLGTTDQWAAAAAAFKEAQGGTASLGVIAAMAVAGPAKPVASGWL